MLRNMSRGAKSANLTYNIRKSVEASSKTEDSGSFGKNGTSNFNDEMEWAWHVESHARYADIVRPFCCLL